jgi:hypothetical protein
MAKNEDLAKYAAGEISISDIKAKLAPGCKLESTTETEVRFPAGKPVEHWKRECSRITDCEDSSNNTDGWVCRPWEFDY